MYIVNAKINTIRKLNMQIYNFVLCMSYKFYSRTRSDEELNLVLRIVFRRIFQTRLDMALPLVNAEMSLIYFSQSKKNMFPSLTEGGIDSAACRILKNSTRILYLRHELVGLKLTLYINHLDL